MTKWLLQVGDEYEYENVEYFSVGDEQEDPLLQLRKIKRCNECKYLGSVIEWRDIRKGYKTYGTIGVKMCARAQIAAVVEPDYSGD